MKKTIDLIAFKTIFAFDSPIGEAHDPPLFQKQDAIQDRFNRWLSDSPEIYVAIEKLALEAFRRGRIRGSVKLFIERIRWDYYFEHDDADFKINDHFSSRIVRKLVSDHPELDGFFETRTLKRD